MVANIRGYTPNYAFKLINFDTPRWHTLEYDNWTTVDALLTSLGTVTVRGIWQNATPYIPGDRVMDNDTGDLYRCLLTHTSSYEGTFGEERVAHDDRWVLHVTGVPLFRSDWSPVASYMLNDIVKYNDYEYYLCVESHTSSTIFDDDKDLYWVTIFDATQTVVDAEAARDAAETSAANALTSENNAATSADEAATSSEAAASAQGAFRWRYDSITTIADPGTSDIRFNNADPTITTQIAISANTFDLGAPDVSDWIASWDDSTNPTNKGTLYVRKSGAPENFVIYTVEPNITDNVSWLHINVSQVAHAGTIADGESVTVAFTRAGNAGTTGAGSGDMLSSNNLSDVESVAEATDNLGLGVTDTPTFNQVHLTIAPGVDDNAATKKYVDDANAALTTMVTAADATHTTDIDALEAAVATATTNIANKVSKLAAGDTMAGNLTIAKNAPELSLNRTSVANSSLNFKVSGLNEFAIAINGANGDFAVNQYNGATGAYQRTPIKVEYASGSTLLSGDLMVGEVSGAPSVYFGPVANNRRVTYTGGNYNFYNGGVIINNGGGLSVSGQAAITGATDIGGDIRTWRTNVSVNTGVIFFGQTGSNFLHWDGGTFWLNGGNLQLQTNNSKVVMAPHYGGVGNVGYGLFLDGTNTYIRTAGNNALDIHNQNSTIGYATFGNGASRIYGALTVDAACAVGTTLSVASSASINQVYTNYLQVTYQGGGGVIIYVVNGGAITAEGHLQTLNVGYQPGGGYWADGSDARIKNILGDYKHGLDEIMQLKPRVFTYKGNDGFRELVDADDKEERGIISPHSKVAELETPFIGLIAQEAESVMPEIVTQRTGIIDGETVDDFRMMNATAVTFALVNAVKTLSVRLEALEATIAASATTRGRTT